MATPTDGPCRILRITGGYSGALIVARPDTVPTEARTRYFRIAAWEIGTHAPYAMHEVSSDEAQSWGLSGMTDSMGFETLPESPFPSLADALCFFFAKHADHLAESMADPSPANGMRGVRIEPDGRNAFRVDIVCGCGRNGLRDEAVERGDFRHRIEIGGPEKILACECGARYRLRPQRDHIHVDAIVDDDLSFREPRALVFVFAC